MDLAQQGPTANAIGMRPSPFAAIAKAVVMVAVISTAILVASQLTGSFTGSSGSDARQFGDTSYNQVEAVRGAIFQAPAPADDTYDQVEALRGAVVLPAGPVDDSFDQVERLRAIPPGQ